MPATPNEKKSIYIEGSAWWNFRDVKFVFLFGLFSCHKNNIDIRRSKMIQGGSSRSQDQGIWGHMSPFGITSLAKRSLESRTFRSEKGKIGGRTLQVNWFHQFLQRYGNGRALFGKIMCDRHRNFLLATGSRKSQGWSDSQSNQKHISKPCHCLLFESQLCCFKYSQSFVSFLIFQVAKSHFLMLESLLLSGDS